MRKLTLFLLLFFSIIEAYSQDWVYSCASDITAYYVYGRCRNVAPGQYIAFIKESHTDLFAERKRLARIFEDTEKYRSYVYSKETYLVDIRQYRVKVIDTIKYDANDNVIDSYRYSEDEEWNYAKPETILEGIIDTVKKIVTKK